MLVGYYKWVTDRLRPSRNGHSCGEIDPGNEEVAMTEVKRERRLGVVRDRLV
jgi:hypothetical protein